ncbi:hypothetical protein PsorP6_003464 [Peronosclerospora sorghi]|uniref:Uncharacterized protein n=1 Tax=Peronosclerospora sorghi TaxID=230839 RepID=A0ACC0VJJ9_9STRA|nr:hypothetical protein PsorP6_003464 [Peronosclerospora sorghi]
MVVIYLNSLHNIESWLHLPQVHSPVFDETHKKLQIRQSLSCVACLKICWLQGFKGRYPLVRVSAAPELPDL